MIAKPIVEAHLAKHEQARLLAEVAKRLAEESTWPAPAVSDMQRDLPHGISLVCNSRQRDGMRDWCC